MQTVKATISSQMQQKIKDVTNAGITRGDPFIKETYKVLRNTGKKLETIYAIEEKVSKGEKVSQEQQAKLKNKQELKYFCDHYIQVIQMYEKNRPAEELKDAETGEQTQQV